jgi:hypothetical protein
MIDLDKIDLDNLQGTKLGTPKFKKYTEAKAGDVLVTGIYRGDYPNKFNADKPNHKFEIKGRQMIVLPAAGQLDYLMDENVIVGDLVRVIYLGQEEMEKGNFKGKKANKFEVELLMEGDKVEARSEAKDDKLIVEEIRAKNGGMISNVGIKNNSDLDNLE